MFFRRKRFWLAALLLVMGAATAAFHLAGKNQLRAEMAEWRRLGLPSNSEELDAWYKAVPTEQNAALVVLEAGDAWVAPSPNADPNQMDLPEPGRPPAPAVLQAIDDYIAKNEETLARLHEAALLPASRYPIDLGQGLNTLLPHLALVKSLATLLKYEAIHHSVRGDRPKAVRSIKTAFALARTLRDEPVLVSQLVRIAILAINCASLEYVLSEHTLTPAELHELKLELAAAEADGLNSFWRALVGERSGAFWIFHANFAQFSALGMGAQPTTQQQVLGRTMFLLYKASGLRNRDARIFLETMEDFIAAATNEFPTALHLTRQADDRMQARFKSGLSVAMISRMLLPALTKAINREAVSAARLRAALMAVEVEQYRQAHGKLPEEFAQTGAEPLLDPFDGLPIAFERQQTGYRIVSEGASKAAGTKKSPLIGITVAR